MPPHIAATLTGITIETKGDVSFRIEASGIEGAFIAARQWNLPGMSIAVQSDGTFSSYPTDRFGGAKRRGSHL